MRKSRRRIDAITVSVEGIEPLHHPVGSLGIQLELGETFLVPEFAGSSHDGFSSGPSRELPVTHENGMEHGHDVLPRALMLRSERSSNPPDRAPMPLARITAIRAHRHDFLPFRAQVEQNHCSRHSADSSAVIRSQRAKTHPPQN